jgi:hypothetical protein
MNKKALRRGGAQLELFRPIPQRPAWHTLPPVVAQRVRYLLVRLMQEHRTQSLARRTGKGVFDE